MRRLIAGLTILSCAGIAAPALAEPPLGEAELVDIEINCSAQIDAYDRVHPKVDGLGAAGATRSMLAQFPNDRAMLVMLGDTLAKASPGILGPTYICASARRVAQIDGAPLVSRAPVAGTASTDSPLGLRDAPAPAQTGALAPDNTERYWLRGRLLAPEMANCNGACPDNGGLSIAVRFPSEPIAYRQTGGQFPGEFGFGTPVPAGIGWTLAIRQQPLKGYYNCQPENADGIVPAHEPAINVAGAIWAVEIMCSLTAKGHEELSRIQEDKRKSDALLNQPGR